MPTLHPYRQARFLLSAMTCDQLPPDIGKEIAFVGRSNAGKSSALNAITQQKQLAKISKTPGRTQAMNIFVIDEKRRFVDLPGYGFAKVPENIKRHWQTELERYFKTRQSLCGLILLMDIRHPLKPLDRQMLDFGLYKPIPIHILLTKADKLTRNQAKRQFNQVEAVLNSQYPLHSTQLFSVVTNEGLEQCFKVLAKWFKDSPSSTSLY